MLTFILCTVYNKHMVSADEKRLRQQFIDYPHMPYLMKVTKLNLLKAMVLQRGEEDEALSICEQIIELSTTENLRTTTTAEEAYQASQILRGAYIHKARTDFESFLIAMEYDRRAEQRFYIPRMKQLQSVVKQMQRLADGELEVLVVSMPPRVGKTTLGLLYITWLGGRLNQKSVLSAGYSSALVNSFYDGCQEFITSDEYNYNEIFPEAPLTQTNAKALTLDMGARRRYKTLTFRSIDGTVTGATEASALLYLDDLVSGIEEAMNINRLESLWAKVSSDMLQRRKEGTPMLVIGTRWSIHDPIGRIEEKYAGSSKVKIMQLPAITPTGESNFNYPYNVGFDDEHYRNLKHMTDTVTWECVYMQNPIERDGLLFTEFNNFYTLPQSPPDDIFAFVDVAFGGKDYLAMPIAYSWGEDTYIVDTVFMRGDYLTTQPIVVGKILAHKIRRIEFEANNGGDFYAKDVVDLLKDKDYKCDIRTKRAPNNISKITRIIQHAPAIKEFFFRDKSLYSPEEQYGQFMNNVETFVQTGNNKNDDAPDSLAGLATMVRSYSSNVPVFYNRRVVGL